MSEAESRSPRAVGLRWAAFAVAIPVIAIAFVPTIDWYSGPLSASTRESISFFTALRMHLGHEIEHFEGMLVFALPSVAALASYVVPWGAPRARIAMAVGTLAIGVWELFLVLVEAHGYGTPYYTLAAWFGIQAMIPEDNYLAHASTVALCGAAWSAIELAHRVRRPVKRSRAVER